MVVSFNVTNLFTSIPVPEVLRIAEEKLRRSNVEPLFLPQFLNLMKVCVEQNYFLLNGDFFKQPQGLAMGSPLSSLLADLVMDDLENSLFNSNLENTHLIHCWYRYVDDIFAVWKGSDRQLDCFVKTLNSRCQNINFTVEKSVNGKLNFLDLTISSGVNGYDFAIFRKPTSTGLVIHNSSRHHISQKLAAFHCMVNRLLDIPLSPTNFNRELSTIKLIAKNNSYDPDIIDRILERKLRKKAYRLVYSGSGREEKDDRKWGKLNYLGGISEKLKSVFPKQKFKIAFYNRKNLRNLLNKTKDRIDYINKSGVYLLKCDTCNAKYVGQTGRSFKVRSEEHKRAYTTGNTQSSHFAKHLWEEDHTSDFQPEVLHLESKGRRLDVMEQWEIRKRVNVEPLLNEIIFPSNSPLLDTKIF
jgi:hypothetical protein